MIDRHDVSRILHEQWRIIVEGDNQELPTIRPEISIGSDTVEVWATVDVSDDPEWDISHMNIPTGLARIEPIRDCSESVRLVIGFDGLGLFNQFTCELILAFDQGLSATEAIISAIREIRSRIAVWREPMSPRQQRGLIGEISILRMLVEHFGDAAVDYWLGPTDTYESLHDFVGTSLHIETKATTTNPPVVEIHDITQLDWRGPYSLILSVVHITEEHSGQSLNEFISETEA